MCDPEFFNYPDKTLVDDIIKYFPIVGVVAEVERFSQLG